MNLTQRQEWLIARYLRAVSDELGDVSDAARERLLNRLRNRIALELRALDAAPLNAAADPVVALIQRLGAPTHAASQLLDQYGETGALALKVGQCVWLGVCSGLAERFGLQARTLRACAIALGLVTGPAALLIYLGLYLEMYLITDLPDVPRIQKGKVVRYLLGTLAAIVAFHLGAAGFLIAVRKVYLKIMTHEGMPLLRGWDWLAVNASFLLFCALAILLPFAVLGALPLANQWDRTVKRLLQAGLALYAVTLAFGMASFLVGLLIQTARELMR
jgi:phage shock protein PspC (stress-responsive transcriptional regulator)